MLFQVGGLAIGNVHGVATGSLRNGYTITNLLVNACIVDFQNGQFRTVIINRLSNKLLKRGGMRHSRRAAYRGVRPQKDAMQASLTMVYTI